MSIARAELARFRLPLRATVTAGGPQARWREGALLVLEDEEGRRGFGEIAPLPGVHRETLDAATAAAVRIAPALRGRRCDDDDARRAAMDATGANAPPSVAFGLEMAWLGLSAKRRGVTPAALLAARPAPRVAIAALFDGGVDEAARALDAGWLHRHPAVKVKVGRRAPAAERAVLELLLARLPTPVALRLDGNRTLDAGAAQRLVGGLSPERIEYFEEPLREPRGLPELAARTAIKIALDETLRAPAGVDVHDASWVAAWVVKPACTGGFARTLALAARARAAGIACVIGSCFESGLGLEALAQLAACVPPPTLAAGLGTDRWLAEDLREPPFSSAAGAVETRDWVGAPAPHREGSR